MQTGKFIKNSAIRSAPKKTAAVEAAAITRVRHTERNKIRLTDRAVPTSNSSAIRRVTAVQIPLVAKVAASI